MLKIHEFILPSGELCSVRLERPGEQLFLVEGGGGDEEQSALPLPPAALKAVMVRYGAPFDSEAACQRQACLELGGGASLTHVRHLAGYDVVARDYLVYAEPGYEPLCAMATSVAGALRHLGLAAKAAAGRAPA